jgi:hypothetical protein
MGKAVAVDAELAVRCDRIGYRAEPATVYRQALVLDLGLVVAETKRGQPPRGRSPLDVGLETPAVDLVGVDKLGDVGSTADDGQLLIAGLPGVHGEIEPQPTFQQLGLDTDLEGENVLGVGHRHTVGLGIHAKVEVWDEENPSLDAGSAGAGSDPSIDVHLLTEEVGGADVPGDETVVSADHDRLERRGLKDGLGPLRGEVFLVVRVAQAALDSPAVRDLVAQRAEQSPGVVLLRLSREPGLGIARRQAVVVVGKGTQVLFEEIETKEPTQAVRLAVVQTELLRKLIEIGNAIGGLRLLRNRSNGSPGRRAGRRKRVVGPKATVDVPAAEHVQGLEAGDRGERHLAKVVVELQHTTLGGDVLLVEAIVPDLVLVEAADEAIRSGPHDVLAENPGRPVHIPAVEVEQAAELLVGLPEKLETEGGGAVAAQGVVLAGVFVVDPVAPSLVEKRQASRKGVGH